MSGRCLTSYINTFVNDKYNIEYVAMLIIPFLYNNPIVPCWQTPCKLV